MIVNNRMAEYIYSILLSQPTILMSWGFLSPRAIQNGLSFHVHGFIHTGRVIIKYNEGQDLFDVYLENQNDEIIDTINMVFFDQLVNVIDDRVEKTDDYDYRIDNEYFK